MQLAGLWPVHVGDGEVRAFGVCRRSPLHAAERAASAGPVLPDDRSLLIGVERPADTRFLTDDDEITAADGDEHRRVAEVEIGSEIFVGRAVGAAAAAAADDEHVLRRHLVGPRNLARVERERHHRVAGRLLRLRVHVAGGDVHDAAFGIHGRRAPDGGARRPPAL